jgi:hypothetical protein
MNPQPDPNWETQVHSVARAFSYPPTPNLASEVQRHLSRTAGKGSRSPVLRPLWAALLVLALLLAGLLASPPTRAAILEWLQIGAVRVWLVEPTATPVPARSTAAPTPRATPGPTATLLPSLLNLDGETSLAAAQAQVDFPIRLPSYPANLGAPDKVFLQNLGDAAVILVWLDKTDGRRVRMSLHLIGPNSWVIRKSQPKVIRTSEVNGQKALWTEGPYLLSKRYGDLSEMRLLQGHVLIWSEATITYRLESDLPLAEAVQVAESLR